MVTDEEANVVWDIEYTPFGELNDPLKAEEGFAQFTGKDLDEDTGLYYYNAKWMDPKSGRFITEDPIKDGLNWYAYANNNPLKFVDPSGLYQVGGQLKDYGMTYGIRTQCRAARIMNVASNAIAGFYIPYVGAGLVQNFRSALDKLDGAIGKNRFSIYKDNRCTFS